MPSRSVGRLFYSPWRNVKIDWLEARGLPKLARPFRVLNYLQKAGVKSNKKRPLEALRREDRVCVTKCAATGAERESNLSALSRMLSELISVMAVTMGGRWYADMKDDTCIRDRLIKLPIYSFWLDCIDTCILFTSPYIHIYIHTYLHNICWHDDIYSWSF